MRNAVVSDWLATSEWSHWRRTSLAGDASARRYERLIGPTGTSVILMDADPKVCGSQSRFVEIADHLSALELAAPDIFAFDDALGLMVLSDLGSHDFRQHLKAAPKDEAALYEAAVDVMIRVQSHPPPHGLAQMTPQIGAQMIELAFDWAAQDASQDLRLEITQALHTLLAEIETGQPALSLRDYHAENLIWRPEKQGLARVGLLDFQDAFVAHPTYDLVSLMRDARRDVDAKLLMPLLARLMGNQDQDVAKKAFHVIAVQRNLRILGIFNRLADRDGKSGYLSLIPRIWGHLKTDLAAPELATLRPLVIQAFGPKD